MIPAAPKTKIYLASRSPRRRELLKQVEEENRRASTGTIGVSVESLGAALGQLGGELNGRGLPVPPPVPGADSETEPRKVRRAGAA